MWGQFINCIFSIEMGERQHWTSCWRCWSLGEKHGKEQWEGRWPTILKEPRTLGLCWSHAGQSYNQQDTSIRLSLILTTQWKTSRAERWVRKAEPVMQNSVTNLVKLYAVNIALTQPLYILGCAAVWWYRDIKKDKEFKEANWRLLLNNHSSALQFSRSNTISDY